MILCGIDTETTGLDTNVDRILEISYVLWDTGGAKPLLMESHIIHDSSYPTLTEDTTVLTGIDKDYVDLFAKAPTLAFVSMNAVLAKYKPKYIVAYNGNNYDKPLILKELARNGVEILPIIQEPWIDVLTDLPIEGNKPNIKLSYLAAEHGFLNPFAHRALFDVLTMFKILSVYPIEAVIENTLSPSLIVRAMLSFEDIQGREVAKKKGFRWQELNGKTYPKMWVRLVKENKLESLRKEVPFTIVRLS